MTDTTDELVDVIAEALWEDGIARSDIVAHEVAGTVLAALVERYGEPEIEEQLVHQSSPKTYKEAQPKKRYRVVFPWRVVNDD